MLRSLQALRGPLTGRLVGGARGVSTGLSSRATSASSPCAAISAGLRRSGGVDEHDAPLSVMAHAVVGAGGIRASDDHLDLRSIQPVVARKGVRSWSMCCRSMVVALTCRHSTETMYCVLSCASLYRVEEDSWSWYW